MDEAIAGDSFHPSLGIPLIITLVVEKPEPGKVLLVSIPL
jgi:hypothetical protein